MRAGMFCVSRVCREVKDTSRALFAFIRYDPIVCSCFLLVVYFTLRAMNVTLLLLRYCG